MPKEKLSRRDSNVLGAAAIGATLGAVDPTGGWLSVLAAVGLKALGGNNTFVDAFALGIGGAGGSRLLAGCGSLPPEQSKSLELQPGSRGDLAFLTAITGINLNDAALSAAANEANRLGLETLIKNPDQMDLFLSSLSQNWSRGSRIAQLQEAIRQGNAFGWSDCSDSRITVPDAISMHLPDLTPAAATGADTATTTFAVEEVRQIGAQPSLFPKGVNQSVLLTHEAIPDCGTGCGFLGGVDTLIKSPADGIAALRHHGVPDETIGYIQEWIAANQSRLASTSPAEWSRMGAEIQSYINFKMYGEQHTVLYGVRAHGTEGVTVGGAVRWDGTEFVDVSTSELPVLEGAINFINRSHPAIEAVVKGQQPGWNVISASRKSPSVLFGELEQNEAFVVNLGAEPITAESVERLVNGAGYSAGSLTQRGKIIELVADTEVEMTQLRQAFLSTSYADEWFKNGGLLAELIPDDVTGLFRKTMRLRNLEYPDGAFLTVTDAEAQALVKAGVKKISGAIRIADTSGGETISVVVSDLNGAEHIFSIPKGSAYSAITAEVLENAGLPVIEALWWEKALVGVTKVLGPVGMIVGIAWMAYDGANLAIDMMGLGKSVQMDRIGKLADIPNNKVLGVINELGLDNTAANAVYGGLDIMGIQARFLERIAVADAAAKAAQLIGYDYHREIPYYVRIDGPQIGIPLLAPDEDIATPIMVSCNYQGEGGNAVISDITYTNVTTNEKMIYDKQPDGTFIKRQGGPDYFQFTTVVTPPSFPNEHLTIPLAFGFDPATKRETIFPNYNT